MPGVGRWVEGAASLKSLSAVAAAEIEQARALGPITLRGDLDVQLDNPRAVLDFKWAGYTRHRDKLEHNTALQLAAYSDMVAEIEAELPPVAYFILEQAALLTPEQGALPGGGGAGGLPCERRGYLAGGACRGAGGPGSAQGRPAGGDWQPGNRHGHQARQPGGGGAAGRAALHVLPAVHALRPETGARMNVQIFTASAGTGKTSTLVEIHEPEAKAALSRALTTCCAAEHQSEMVRLGATLKERTRDENSHLHWQQRVRAILETARASRPACSPPWRACALRAALHLWRDPRSPRARVEPPACWAAPGTPRPGPTPLWPGPRAPPSTPSRPSRPCCRLWPQPPAFDLKTAFDTALEAIGLRQQCAAWGDASQRLANVDAMRGMGVAYAAACRARGEACTLTGLLYPLDKQVT